MAKAGTLLQPRFLLPVRPARRLLRQHAVRIVDGRIDDILPLEDARARYAGDRHVDLDRHVLLPGLINAHTHSPMTLLRGYADDLPLDEWLRGHIWPAEQRWVSREFVRDGMELAAAEMLRGGVTCFNEMYFFPKDLAEVADRVGLRALIGAPVIDVTTPWASGIDDCLDKAAGLIDRLAGHERLAVALAPHAPYTVDDRGLAEVRALADRRDVRINMHVLEAAGEAALSRDRHGVGPLERLDSLGLLSPQFMAVHLVHAGQDDVERLASSGAHVIHCPESNLKLANGVCPVEALRGAGINVAIGTDGAASNNNLDLLGEARTASLLAKGVGGDPQALDAWQTLDLLTINGARALGMGDTLGTIEVGKVADLVALDLSHPETQPIHHVESQLVYSAATRQVSDVWVGGQRLLTGGELTTLDLSEVVARAESWNERMAVVQ